MSTIEKLPEANWERVLEIYCPHCSWTYPFDLPKVGTVITCANCDEKYTAPAFGDLNDK